MRLFIIFFLTLILTGCQQMQEARNAEANKKYEIAIEKCADDIGFISSKNVVIWQNCINQARSTKAQDRNYSFMWVLQQNLSADSASALEYSNGRITKKEYLAEISQHYFLGEKMEQQAQMQSSQQSQQNIQALLAIQGMMQKPQPMPQSYMPSINRPIQTNCNAYGNSISCSSY